MHRRTNPRSTGAPGRVSVNRAVLTSDDVPMSSITVEIQDHVAVVTLDRPPVNAVDRPTFDEIRDAFSDFNDDREVRVAVFTAVGDRAFMAGVDLRSVNQPLADPPASRQLDPARAARDAMWAITDCAVPVIGAINGPALGAGVAFAACCDILLASDNATFGTTEINVGLLGASSHLSLLVGRYKAREMFFTGEVVPAAELYRLGAVRSVVPRDQLMPTAIELARVLAAKSPIALRLAKDSMNRVEYLPLKEAYRTEQDYTAKLRGFDDSTEAQQAFLEKRDPDWKWR
jgi:enoyl-CoA hydratase